MTDCSADDRPWRKRHPVLSRVVLYGVGLVGVAVAVGLLLQRRDLDAQDQLQYLEGRLISLDLLFGTPPGREQIREVLREEFAAADVPPQMRARALRVEAQLEAKDGHHDLALERLAQAQGLSQPSDALFASILESAEILQLAGRGAEALTALDEAGAPPTRTLVLVAASIRAWLLEERGRADEGRKGLAAELERQALSWQDAAPVVVGIHEVRPSEAWIQATRSLGRLGSLEPRDWMRVADLFPRDAVALVSSVRGLLALDDRDGARRLWSRLEAHDPMTADGEAAADPRLAALRENVEEGLQGDVDTGR